MTSSSNRLQLIWKETQGERRPPRIFPLEEAKEADMETQRLDEEGSAADQQHEIIEIEDSDEEEDDEDEEWDRQETIEDTTMAANDRSTYSYTSTGSSTLTTRKSNTSKSPTRKKIGRPDSTPANSKLPPFTTKASTQMITKYFNKLKPVSKGAGSGSR